MCDIVSRGGNSLCGGVDIFKVNDWGRMNDWDDGEGILIGDGCFYGLWMLVYEGRDELYTF